MANYENMNTSEVQRLAKQGDRDALYEMAWRMPPEIENDPIDSCAWQDIFLEKAADAGHVDARTRYARSLIDRVMNAEDRQKAMKYYESLVSDYNAGKLTGDLEDDGIIAMFWLGVMLCQGYHTQRDAVRGEKLIESAYEKTNGFSEYGFKYHWTIGEIFATGLAQPGEDPSVSDLGIAIKHLEIAIGCFNQERDDPNNRGIIQIIKDMLELQKKRVVNQMILRGDNVCDLSDAEKDARRNKLMELSEPARQRLQADKAAVTRLRQQLTNDGWKLDAPQEQGLDDTYRKLAASFNQSPQAQNQTQSQQPILPQISPSQSDPASIQAVPLQPPKIYPGKGQCVASLVLGICSFIFILWASFVGFPAALVGLILGVIGKKKAREAGAPTKIATAGITTSIISLIINLLGLTFCIALIVELS